MSRKTLNPGDAVAIALKFLSLRVRSVKEVSERLKTKGFSEREIDSTVTLLTGAGYLNDEKFAQMLLSTRVKNKRWGPAKIASELSSKGIAPELVQKALSGIDAAAEARTADEAFKKWIKKSNCRPPLDKKAFSRAFRHLKGRGFSTHTVMTVLNGFKEAEEEQWQI